MMAFLLMHGLRVHIKLGPIHFIPVAENMSIVDAIILLGHRMKLCVTAEGVETKEQLDCLVEHGCDKAQGYYFSKPLPPEEAIRMVQKKKNKVVP